MDNPGFLIEEMRKDKEITPENLGEILYSLHSAIEDIEYKLSRIENKVDDLEDKLN